MSLVDEPGPYYSPQPQQFETEEPTDDVRAAVRSVLADHPHLRPIRVWQILADRGISVPVEQVRGAMEATR